MEKSGRQSRPEPRNPAPSAELKVVEEAGLAPEKPRERAALSPWVHWAAIFLTLYLGLQLLGVVGTVLLRVLPMILLVVFGALLAFMLAPMVKGLVTLGFPRTLASLAV